MKAIKILLALILVSSFAVSCKKEVKKNEEKKQETAQSIQEASFAISGMTCEIGCAKTIASKLSKKEGVIDAKVVFNDSIATVKYHADKTNKKEIIAFIDGLVDGKTYKSSEVSKKECSVKEKKECSKKAKKECHSKKETAKTACVDNCKKQCCSEA